MNLRKILGIALLAAGILALAYRGFNYTKETHNADLGPIKFQVKEKEHVDIPVWLGAALAAGGGLLLAIGKK